MPPQFAITDVEHVALSTYLGELAVWNRRINLTRIAADDWWQRHIEESLVLAPYIAVATAGAEPRGEANDALRVVDMGSGGGTPGIPLAIVRRDVEFTLVDSDVRKCGFLTHVAGVIGLTNVRVVVARAEVMGHDPSERECHDICVSRATAPLPVLAEFCLPLLRSGGSLHALVSEPRAAAESARAASELLGGDVPEATTNGVVTIVKRAPTPEMYPRRTGVPLRRPLPA